MTEVTIKLETNCNLLGIFLHPPGRGHPIPLPGVAHSVTRELDTGIFALSVSGTGEQPGEAVKFTISSAVNKVTRSRRVSADGTITAWITFEVAANGAIS